MKAKSRLNKGKAGEREIAAMLRYATGYDVQRNLSQTRGGGHDLNGIPGLSIEVKRQEKLQINTWWNQTIKQALNSDSIPILAYRQNGRAWNFIVGYTQVRLNREDFIIYIKSYILKLSTTN